MVSILLLEPLPLMYSRWPADGLKDLLFIMDDACFFCAIDLAFYVYFGFSWSTIFYPSLTSIWYSSLFADFSI